MSSEDEEDNNELVESEPVEAELPPTEKELAEARSLESRRKMREQMQADIEAFLNKPLEGTYLLSVVRRVLDSGARIRL